ncbi:hypothetical protein BZG04_01360 [Salinivibrio kushneri]|uniref:hypothetical protein n=1 Tax=Salinivibrio kushneri TaxID=1908198 RepID=UPI0009897571|nr:hypothetical protein [Salinivibrio kushneri]OOE33495.1 hypothetical protein BZG05_10710 [Salinivibrio kushneri]OOE37830.1 hypothetical protein BZG04_01360 [Salinivibrio kushneri]
MKVFIDHNVWDELANRQLDLSVCFPENEFTLYITKHGKFEVQQTPDSCIRLKSYIKNYLGSVVHVDALFGFKDSSLPDNEQRTGGFGLGRFSCVKDEDFRKELIQRYGSKEKRKESQILYKQEADIELGVRALKFPVLTLDIKAGPLKEAYERGGKVVLLDREFIRTLSNDEFVNHIKERVSSIISFGGHSSV